MWLIDRVRCAMGVPRWVRIDRVLAGGRRLAWACAHCRVSRDNHLR